MGRRKDNPCAKFSPTCLTIRHTIDGQAHMILTVLGVAEPEPLDLLIMFRMKGVAP